MSHSSFRRLLGTILILGLSGRPLVASAAVTATWDGTSANWTNAQHWSTAPLFPNNAGANVFDAVVNAGSITLDQNITINQLSLGGGSINGTSSLSVLEGLQWTAGSIRGSGVLSIGAAASIINGGVQPLVLSGRTMNLSGSATFSAGTIRGGSGAIINNAPGATFTALNNAAFFAEFGSANYTFNNSGTFVARSSGGLGFTSMDARFNNSGAIRLELSGTASGHTLSLAGGGTHSGSFELPAGTSVELGGTTTLNAGATFAGAGTALMAGNVVLDGNVSMDNVRIAVGELNLGGNVLSAGISGSQTGGTLRIGAGGILQLGAGKSWNMDDGTITGSGTLAGALDTQGAVSPGIEVGTLSVTGGVTFGTDSRLNIQIAGSGAASIDRLAATGPAVLGGELQVRLENGFLPAPGQTFTILTASVVSGVFENAPNDGARFVTADGLGSFEVDYTPTSIVLINGVPEPSSSAILTLTAMGAFGLRRRTSRA